MGVEYDSRLCDERHAKQDKEIEDVWKHHNHLRDSINGKFNKIMFGIFMTLLSVIASLIITIVYAFPHIAKG